MVAFGFHTKRPRRPDMSYNPEAVTARAIETLNAPIAGGNFPSSLIQEKDGKLIIGHDALREVELELRGYHSTWPHPAPRPKPESV
jgi:hypothetical protein